LREAITLNLPVMSNLQAPLFSCFLSESMGIDYITIRIRSLNSEKQIESSPRNHVFHESTTKPKMPHSSIGTAIRTILLKISVKLYISGDGLLYIRDG